VVDIQERLAAAMPEGVRQRVFRNAGILLRASALLEVPQVMTEQYPQGLGETDAAVRQYISEHVQYFEKTSFSCCGALGFTSCLEAVGRRQVVIAGMEAHVCVLQTALELKEAKFAVYVVEDAVCSRTEANCRNAMGRLRQAGVVVTNTESVLFEWLRHSRQEHFRAISKMVR